MQYGDQSGPTIELVAVHKAQQVTPMRHVNHLPARANNSSSPPDIFVVLHQTRSR